MVVFLLYILIWNITLYFQMKLSKQWVGQTLKGNLRGNFSDNLYLRVKMRWMYYKIKFRILFSKYNLLQQIVCKSPFLCQICSQLSQLHYMKIKHPNICDGFYDFISWRLVWYKMPQLLFRSDGAWERNSRFRASPGILMKKHLFA